LATFSVELNQVYALKNLLHWEFNVVMTDFLAWTALNNNKSEAHARRSGFMTRLSN
jgi:hypothetical protein